MWIIIPSRVQHCRRPNNRPVKSKKKLQSDKCRMSISECRIKESFLFYFFKKGRAKRFHLSTFVNLHSSFDVVSHERCRWPRASSLIGKETAPNLRSFR
ncbi:hypothetical protein D1AOALGA4SA_3390 [Olavius algarvensis Delta 1 endosymbiont]|nr:hypothetical protein D1AOALGA4SA_3390 [Olavius algarvensis Delta 1 endosymbiont]